MGTDPHGSLRAEQRSNFEAPRAWSQVAGGRAAARRRALQAVAFAALPGPSGAYLVEAGYEIHYLATERELFRTPSRQRGEGLLVVGAPAFDATDAEIAAAASSIPGTEPAWPVQAATVGTRPDATSSVATAASAATRGRRSECAAAARLSFGELPGSALEAADVAAIWQATGGGPVSLLTGAAAGTEAFRSLVAGRRIVHVATHGFYLGAVCGGAGSEESPTSENPMLLAGLAFAGAGSRHAASGDDDDGILTAEEISRLPLEGAEWIVLSACDTGQGQVEQREGVLGLRQAFSTAGARTLISSLWPVDDAQTRGWMMALYRARLERGMDTARAAATANLELLRALREHAGHGHPALWAAFVGSGDWR